MIAHPEYRLPSTHPFMNRDYYAELCAVGNLPGKRMVYYADTDALERFMSLMSTIEFIIEQTLIGGSVVPPLKTDFRELGALNVDEAGGQRPGCEVPSMYFNDKTPRGNEPKYQTTVSFSTWQPYRARTKSGGKLWFMGDGRVGKASLWYELTDEGKFEVWMSEYGQHPQVNTVKSISHFGFSEYLFRRDARV